MYRRFDCLDEAARAPTPGPWVDHDVEDEEENMGGVDCVVQEGMLGAENMEKTSLGKLVLTLAVGDGEKETVTERCEDMFAERSDMERLVEKVDDAIIASRYVCGGRIHCIF